MLEWEAGADRELAVGASTHTPGASADCELEKWPAGAYASTCECWHSAEAPGAVAAPTAAAACPVPVHAGAEESPLAPLVLPHPVLTHDATHIPE